VSLRAAAVLSLATVAVSVIRPDAADAITYYVMFTGNDSAGGGAGDPFRTLQRGVSQLKPGDVLLVGPGVYSESLFGTIPAGTSWIQPVTIRALDAADRPVIRPPAGSSRVLHFQGGQHYIIVDGFVLDGQNVSSDVVKITSGGEGAAHHIRVTNCEIKNGSRGSSLQQGVLITGGAEGNELIDNHVYDNGSDDFMHGLYLATGNNLVQGNRIYRNAGWGVHVYAEHGGVHGNVVRDNIVYDNARAGNRGAGILLSSGSRNLAFNNVVWNNNGGITVTDAADTRVLHNTIVNNRGSGLGVTASLRTIIRNNIVYRNPLNAGGSETQADTNLVGVDPMFVSETLFNFRLLSTSPAIDGAVGSEVTSDADGRARPYGSAPDVGAYEFRPDVVVPSAPTNLRIIR
jgi:parallel beta-helix repeat protein